MSEIDKNALYGNFQRYQDQRQRLGMQAARKALDLADDEMNINANRTGIGPLGLLGAVVSGAGAVIAGAMLLRSPPAATAPAPAPVTVAPASPDLQEMEQVEQVQQPDGSWKDVRRIGDAWYVPKKSK